MALQGTLEDLGIVEVIQIPQRSRQTGLLEVTGHEGIAQLFYNKGALVHATLGAIDGIETLVKLTTWENASFTFKRGYETTDRSITIDLHQAMMQAFKIRDERKREEELQQQRGMSSAGERNGNLEERLNRFIAENSFAAYGCVFDEDGYLVCEAAANDRAPDGLEAIQDTFVKIKDTYPGRPPYRVVIDKDETKSVYSALEDGRGVLVISTGSVPMGAVMIAVGKLSNLSTEA
jgi:repressor of nif and glnA expression